MSFSKSPKRKKMILPDPKHAPPPEERYCIQCDTVTLWSYNRVIGHGCCKECGATSLYGGINRDDVLNKLELHKVGFNFLSLKRED